jgi:hypothetical protein
LRHLVLYPASRRFDFLPGARAHPDSAHGNALRRFAVGEKLGWASVFSYKAGLSQSFFRHFGAFRQLRQIVESDDLILYPKDIRETTLWDAAGKRHLAALEPGLAATRAVVARARLDALVSLTGSLTGARARTASEPLRIPVRSRGWNQIVQANALTTF